MAPTPAVPAALPVRASWQSQLAAEAYVQVQLSAPISGTYLVNFGLILTSQVLCGHVSSQALAAASLATMWANATGMAIMIGATAAVETLCSQAFGAGNLPRVGAVAQRGAAVQLALCLPIACAWLAAAPALAALGQDPAVVALGEAYIQALLLGLPAIAVYEVLKRALQSMSIAAPQLAISCAALLFNGALGAALVYGTPAGFYGAPLALAASQWLMLGLMICYLRNHRRVHAVLRAVRGGGGGGGERQALAADAAATTVDSSTFVPVATEAAALPDAAAPPPPPPPLPPPPPPPPPLDTDDVLDAAFSLPLSAATVLSGWPEYLRLGIPSALVLVTEWSSFECAALIAGVVSTPTLAAHTVLASTAALSFMPPLGLSIAAGVRIGQLCGEGGAGEAGALGTQRAKRAYAAALALNAGFVLANAAVVLAFSSVWGYVFTEDADVIALVAGSLWMLALYSAFDSCQCISSGGLRGLGLPGWGAAANIVGWCCVGVPLAYYLAVVQRGALQGIWFAFTIAVATVFALMSAVLACTDWQAIAVKARARALQGAAPAVAAAAATAAEAAAAASASALSATAAAAEAAPGALKLPAAAAAVDWA